MSDHEEVLEVVNYKGKVIGILPRTRIHGNPSLIHRVIHVLIFNGRGELLLQKRSLNKDVAPGKWDTSVGGHVNPGEKPFDAVRREMEEELGVTPAEPRFLYTYLHSNSYETELVYSYSCLHEGKIVFNPHEIDTTRFWSLEEIRENMGKGILSDNFEQEISMYMQLSAISDEQ